LHQLTAKMSLVVHALVFSWAQIVVAVTRDVDAEWMRMHKANGSEAQEVASDSPRGSLMRLQHAAVQVGRKGETAVLSRPPQLETVGHDSTANQTSEATAVATNASGAASATSVTATITKTEQHAAESESTVWSLMRSFMLLVHGLTFGFVIKAVCMAGNVLVQVSPIPQVKGWEINGNTGEVDAAPYVSIAFSGWNWCFYGLFAYFVTQRSGFVILVYANCLGAVMGSYYMWAFNRYCKDGSGQASFQRYLSAAGALVFLQAFFVLTLPMDRSLFMCGLVSSFCSFTAAVSILVVVPSVIRSKDSSNISGPLVVANFFSAIAWCICGWMLQDPLVYSPNIMTASASSLCIYLKFKYHSSARGKFDGQELSDLAEEDRALANKAAAMLKALYRGKARDVPGEFTPLIASLPAHGRRIGETNFEGSSGRFGDYAPKSEPMERLKGKLLESTDDSDLVSKGCGTGGTC
jgi:uncharacterized protein with PQ loop repeat